MRRTATRCGWWARADSGASGGGAGRASTAAQPDHRRIGLPVRRVDRPVHRRRHPPRRLPDAPRRRPARPPRTRAGRGGPDRVARGGWATLLVWLTCRIPSRQGPHRLPRGSDARLAREGEAMSEHEHRFGQTWYAIDGWIVDRWCVDCDQWVTLTEPVPTSEAKDFPRERPAVV